MALGNKDVGPEKSTGMTYKGKEITLTKTRGRPYNGMVQMGINRGIYPDEKYLEAATLYAITGTLETIERLTGIPVSTLRKWTREERFKEIVREVRQENNEKIDAKFTQIIEKSCDLILDRLEHGDHVWDTKRGELIRKPVGAKDLSLVTAINIDKRQLIRGEPTQRVEQVNEDTRLEKLAAQFSKIANQFKDAPKLTPVIDVEVVRNEEGS